MNDTLLTKLTVGTVSPFLGIVVSHQAINEWLQTISLVLGIAVGLITLASIRFKKK